MGAQRKVQKNHIWIDAIAEPDELVINVGDMLSTHQ
jgi:isopenicillin N synthase-like dioxygenase